MKTSVAIISMLVLSLLSHSTNGFTGGKPEGGNPPLGPGGNPLGGSLKTFIFATYENEAEVKMLSEMIGKVMEQALDEIEDEDVFDEMVM